MVKVTLLVVVEIGLFPLICGWWLDICSLVGILCSCISLQEKGNVYGNNCIGWLDVYDKLC